VVWDLRLVELSLSQSRGPDSPLGSQFYSTLACFESAWQDRNVLAGEPDAATAEQILEVSV
jgi:hypothetical protein